MLTIIESEIRNFATRFPDPNSEELYRCPNAAEDLRIAKLKN